VTRDYVAAVGGPAFDITMSKLLHPPVRPGGVLRSCLVERLANEDSCPIVSVVAPAGYGKSTLLSQWAERGGPAFAWISLDDRDNDPKVLLTYVAEALNRVQPLSQRVFDALASPASSVPGSVVPRLGTAFASITTPVVLVLDDVHLLSDRECRDALSVLADHVPPGSRLVLAGRDKPLLLIARLRAEGRILEIGPADLALTRAEAASLLRGAGLTLGTDEVAALHRRTEGWPVGLYLAALCLREGGDLGRAAMAFDGDDRLMREYVESEFLSRVSPRQRVFLARSAVLDRMSGTLCEAALELPMSERSLVAMAGHDWDRADVLAGQAGATLRRARIEESYVAPLVCAVQARTALHRGDIPSARQELVRAQRARPLLTYATPHVAVQARIQLTRVHLALADTAGARTLLREIDEILERRPDLGTLTGEAQALRTRLAADRAPSALGASSLAAAELRVLSCPCSPRTCRSRRSAPRCSCRPTPSSPRPCRSTASSAPPPGTRPSPDPANWALSRGEQTP